MDSIFSSFDLYLYLHNTTHSLDHNAQLRIYSRAISKDFPADEYLLEIWLEYIHLIEIVDKDEMEIRDTFNVLKMKYYKFNNYWIMYLSFEHNYSKRDIFLKKIQDGLNFVNTKLFDNKCNIICIIQAFKTQEPNKIKHIYYLDVNNNIKYNAYKKVNEESNIKENHNNKYSTEYKKYKCNKEEYILSNTIKKISLEEDEIKDTIKREENINKVDCNKDNKVDCNKNNKVDNNNNKVDNKEDNNSIDNNNINKDTITTIDNIDKDKDTTLPNLYTITNNITNNKEDCNITNINNNKDTITIIDNNNNKDNNTINNINNNTITTINNNNINNNITNNNKDNNTINNINNNTITTITNTINNIDNNKIITIFNTNDTITNNLSNYNITNTLNNNINTPISSYKIDNYNMTANRNIKNYDTKIYTENRRLYLEEIRIKERIYYIIKKIGRGGSGTVYLVLHKDILYAMKKVRVRSEGMNNIMREIEILEGFKGCEGIIQMIEWERRGDILYILLEYGEYDLSYVMRESMSVNKIMDLWIELLSIMKKVYEKRIIHKDLKPANFVFVRGKIKLIDFGISNEIPSDTTNVLNKEIAGSINYMAPERIREDGNKIGRSTDIWSLGVILYEMVYRRVPSFKCRNILQKMEWLKSAVDIEYGDIDICYSKLIYMVKKCLVYEPKHRASVEDLIEMVERQRNSIIISKEEMIDISNKVKNGCNIVDEYFGCI